MAIEMEGLEFQIETKAEESAKGIDALSKSLGSLKKALKGGLGLGSSVKQLERLTTATNSLKSDKLTEMTTLSLLTRSLKYPWLARLLPTKLPITTLRLPLT